MTAFSEEDMRGALERARNSPATKLARDTLAAGDVLTRDPRYPDLERQVGPQAARRVVLDNGMAALSDRFLRDSPSITPSEPTQAEGERRTFAALQSLFPHIPAERLGSVTGKVFGRLSRGRQLQLASNTADAGAIISSVLHVDPNAARAKAQQQAAAGTDAAAGAAGAERGERADKRKGDAFARDAFGRHIHSGEQKAGSSGSSERYTLLPGSNAMTYGAERYSFAQMQQFASAQGVPWAVHSPELMKLGPSALKVLGDTHFKQETFQRLTKGAGFQAKDAVNIARFARDRKMDANHLGGEVAGTVVALEPGKTPESKARRGDLNHAYGAFFADPTNPTTKQGVLKLRPRYEKDPAQLRRFDGLNRKVGIQSKVENRATIATAAKATATAVQVAKANASVAKADASQKSLKGEGDAFAALPDGPPASPKAKPSSAPAPKVG